MDSFERAAGYLPADLRELLRKIPPALRLEIQEIRLRADAPLILSAPSGEWAVSGTGQVTEKAETAGRICTKQELEETFEALCEYSVHSHQQELRQGYISTRSGCRAGVAGTTVVEGGQVVSMRSITSLCIRVARPHPGCAASLARALTDSRGRVHSALLCGEPSSGKSSLLRDLARQLSQGLTGRRYRVSVIDERGELSRVPEAPGQASLRNCDVLLYCPKPAGIGQAVRCLAPDVLLFDELGGEDEVDAVTAGLFAGVAAIASAHCRDRDSLLRRQAIRRALENGAFDYVVMLAGRGRPGEVAGIFETEAWLHENSGLAPHRGGGTAPRFDGGGRTPAAGVDARPTVPVYGQIGGSDPLYCGAGGRAADSG